MDSEEAEILRTMIQDRDKRIATIMRKTEEDKAKEERIGQELDDVNDETNRLQIDHQTVKTRLLHSHQTVSNKLQAVQRDLQHQSNSLMNYAQVISKQKDLNSGDPKLIMRMQAQLCKAMHSMGILDHQLELFQEQSDDLVKLQRDAIARTTEEKATLEIDLLNELMKTDSEKREIEGDLGGQLDDIYKEITSINEQLEDSDSEEEQEDEEEELDEEEKAAKEEAFKLLQSNREKIESLESKTEEQAELIEELQAQLSEFEAAASMPNGAAPAPSSNKPPPSSEKIKEPEVDPNDIMAVAAARARAAKSDHDDSSDSDVEEIDDLDLLKMAQSRMSGPPPKQEESEAEESETTDYDDSMNEDESSDDDDIVEGPAPPAHTEATEVVASDLDSGHENSMKGATDESESEAGPLPSDGEAHDSTGKDEDVPPVGTTADEVMGDSDVDDEGSAAQISSEESDSEEGPMPAGDT